VGVDAVVFDLDGVVVDSEEVWDEARRDLVRDRGGRWLPEATTDMLGMSSHEWARYLRERLGVDLQLERVNEEVVRRVAERYRRELPLLEGARDAVLALARRWPLGLATSSNRPVIDLVLNLAGLREAFRATVSSEEVGRGKPAPDVYLEAARRLGVAPTRAVAIEDSGNGIRSASAAGMGVVAVPNRTFPPGEDALALAAAVLPDIRALTPEVVERAAPGRPRHGSGH
jgi:HAD superfamily hydrolase (TIGR01509 family)